VQTLLDDHRHLVIALRDELLERSELVGDEIVDVLREAEARRSLSTAAGELVERRMHGRRADDATS
jgi:hypothetical protein